MENFEKRGGAEQISVGVIGMGGAKVAREGLPQRLPPPERPMLYGNEGSRVIW